LSQWSRKATHMVLVGVVAQGWLGKQKAQRELAATRGTVARARARALVSGRCPHCEKAVTELLAPAPKSALDQTGYLARLGAVGLLTGLALASAGEEAG